MSQGIYMLCTLLYEVLMERSVQSDLIINSVIYHMLSANSYFNNIPWRGELCALPINIVHVYSLIWFNLC